MATSSEWNILERDVNNKHSIYKSIKSTEVHMFAPEQAKAMWSLKGYTFGIYW